MNLLNELFLALEKTGTVPAKNKPHKLTGNYKGFWECRIQPDWLLIWFHNDTAKIIELTRTGTHSDLF
jgi:mRNA interferase YafQ